MRCSWIIPAIAFLPPPQVAAPPPQPPRDAARDLRREVEAEAARLAYPDATASPRFRILLRRDAGEILGLAPEQRDLVKRLDETAREAVRSSLLRGLDDATDAELAARLSEVGLRHRRAIVAHAEAIAVDGVLDARQAEAFRLIFWRRMGMHALREPDLASRLKLTRHQREAILRRIEGTKLATLAAEEELGHLRLMSPHDEGGMEIATRADREVRRRTAHAERLVWDVLTPAQAATLERILSTPYPTRPPAQPR